MNKIFDKTVEKYLKETGVSDKEIMRLKYKNYKLGMLEIANTLIDAIKNDDVNIISKYFRSSPAGDDMGLDNIFISFDTISEDERNDGIDVEDAFTKLNDFKTHSKFDDDITNCNVSNDTNMDRMFDGSPLQSNQPDWQDDSPLQSNRPE